MEYLVNPQMHVLKIADTASGEIVGYGRWLIPESLGFGTSVPDLSEQAKAAAQDPKAFAPRPMNEALLAAFRGLLNQTRKRHATEQDMSQFAHSLVYPAVSGADPVSARSAGDIACLPGAWNRHGDAQMGHDQGRCMGESHLSRSHGRRISGVHQPRLPACGGGCFRSSAVWRRRGGELCDYDSRSSICSIGI